MTEKKIEDFINYLCKVGIKTKLFDLWRPYLKDLFDDHVLEVTIQSNASTIVTYNKKDFKEAENLGLKILTPKEFLETLEVVDMIFNIRVKCDTLG